MQQQILQKEDAKAGKFEQTEIARALKKVEEGGCAQGHNRRSAPTTENAVFYTKPRPRCV